MAKALVNVAPLLMRCAENPARVWTRPPAGCGVVRLAPSEDLVDGQPGSARGRGMAEETRQREAGGEAAVAQAEGHIDVRQVSPGAPSTAPDAIVGHRPVAALWALAQTRICS